MSLLDKSVVLPPPYATKSIYMVVKEYEHKGTAKVRLRHPTSGSEYSKIASEIRIASDEEQERGHRIDPHKAFEEWFKEQPFYGKLVYMYGDRIFDFDYADQTYRTLTVNVSWLTWQHKEKQLEGHRFVHDALAQVSSKQEASLKGVNTLIDEYRDPPTEDKTFRHALSIVASELEQALKGCAQ